MWLTPRWYALATGHDNQGAAVGTTEPKRLARREAYAMGQARFEQQAVASQGNGLPDSEEWSTRGHTHRVPVAGVIGSTNSHRLDFTTIRDGPGGAQCWTAPRLQPGRDR